MKRWKTRILAGALSLLLTAALPLEALAGHVDCYNEPIATSTPNRDAALKNGKVFQLAIRGDDVVGGTLTGSYEFYSLIHTADSNTFTTGGTEEGSTYRWLRGDSRTGTYTAIDGAVDKTYTLTEADVGQYICFEVTPRAKYADGTVTTGETVQSEPVGPVLTEAEFASIRNLFSKTASIYENDAAIAAQVQRKFGDATYFVCDTTAGIATIHGSPYASVGGVKQSMEGLTPTMDDDNQVWVTAAFLQSVLGLSYDMGGADTVNLQTVADALGKRLWIGTADLAEGGNYRTTPLAKGLVFLSDKDLEIDVIRDRDLLNEAANSLYVLRSTEEQMAWFRAAKYGMFIHWDPSSITRVEISWDRQALRPGEGVAGNYFSGVADPQYDSLYMDFNPTAWDADALMKEAKENGLQYVVFTTKHHGAFANFQTEYRTDFSIANTPYKDGAGDIVKELADAAHKYGLKLGFYYSPRDWSNPYYYTTEHYRYLEYYLGQLTELCSNYGGLDILWFDSIGQRNGAAMGYSDAMSAWDTRTILRRIRQMQPDIIINNRYAASLASYNDTPYDVMGDWNTPETRLSTFDDSRPWESCMCPDASGGHWSDHWSVTSYISVEKALQYLINNTCNDGNLLMDYGPTATGAMRQENQAIYDGVGQWLKTYGESIFNTRGGPYKNTNSWGGSTYRINDDGTCTMYLHVSPLLLNCHQTTGNTLTIPVAPDGRTYDLENAYLLSDKAKVDIVEQGGQYTITLPEGESWSTIDTVIVLQESLSAAAQAAIEAAEVLLNQEVPLLQAQADVLRAAVAALEAQPTGETLQALLAATKLYELQLGMADSLTTLQALLEQAVVGTNPWECTAEQYNRAVLVCESALALAAGDEITEDAVDLMNENLQTQITLLRQTQTQSAVTFSPAAGSLTPGGTVTMTAPVSYAQIRYTTDGSEPTADSALYTGPLTPGDGLLTLKAKAFFGDEPVSATAEKTYLVGSLTNLALNQSATASNYYQNNPSYAPGRAFDGQVTGSGGESRWATDDGTTSAWIQVDLGSVQEINTLSLQEYLSPGQTTRISDMAILCSADGETWQTVQSGLTGGADVRYTFETVEAKFVKLNLNRCDNPTIYEIQVSHAQPATLESDSLTLEVETNVYTPGVPLAVAAYGMVDGAYLDSTQANSGISFTASSGSVEHGALTVPAGVSGEVTLYASVGELRSNTITLTAAGGETNIALGASAKGSSNYNEEYSAPKAVDGQMNTRWASQGNPTTGSDYKTELELTGLSGNYFSKIVIEEYVEPNEGESRCEYVEAQYKNADGSWQTAAKWTGGNTAEAGIYSSELTCAGETFTRNGNSCTGSKGTVFTYDGVGWYNKDYGYYRCTHTLTFDKVQGEEVLLRFTNTDVSLYEVEVWGGTEQRTEIPPERIELLAGGASVGVDGTAQIDAAVHPRFATNQTLTYTSSDDTVATVSENGLVTGVKAGSAEITVAAQADPTVKAVFYVGVQDSEKTAQPITVSAQGGSLTVKEAEYPGLRVLVTARGDDGKSLSWVKLNGEPLPVAAGATAFSFVMPDGPAVLTAGFGQEEPPTETYTIAVTQTTGGTITPGTVTVQAGESQTFAIQAAAGYVLRDVLVDGVSRGADSTVTFENVQADHTLKALFRRVQQPGPETRPQEPEEKPAPAASEFYDVRATDWYAEAVAYVSEQGLMTGVAEGVFDPNGAVTRAMVWTVLARMDGETTEGGSTWYAKAQRWAMENGVSDGTDPMGSITREQLAAMLYRFAGSPAVGGSLSAYPDAASVSDWAVDALVWATETGLINGMNGYLSPMTGATRAQLAAMLQRFETQ